MSKCPKCYSRQNSFNVLLINNFSNRECNRCGCNLALSTPISLFVIFLEFIALKGILHFKVQLGTLTPILIGITFVLLILLFMFAVPLVEKEK